MNNAFNLTADHLMTPRLILRPMDRSDEVQVVEWRNSQHIASMSIQTFHSRLTIDDHRQWFSNSRSNRLDYIIELRDEKLPIGSLSFSWKELSDCQRCAELGKYIGDLTRLGKGYASEATARWLKYGFEDIGLSCVIARTRATNAANIKVNRRLGFAEEPWPEHFGDQSPDWIFMRLKKRKLAGRSKTTGSL